MQATNCAVVSSSRRSAGNRLAPRDTLNRHVRNQPNADSPPPGGTNPFHENPIVQWSARSQITAAFVDGNPKVNIYFSPDGTEYLRQSGTTEWSSSTYDPAKNRLSYWELTAARTTYTYDPTNQLLGENRTGTYPYAVTYTYDPLGNRLTANRAGAGPLPAGVTTMQYNAANELTLSQPPTGAPTTITYDANGNTLLENTGGSLTTYTWDFENRMTSAAYPDGTAETYTYYSDGRRASKDTSTGLTYFVWDRRTLLQELTSTFATTTYYTTDRDAVDFVFCQRRNNVSSFYYYDASGNTRQLQNSASGRPDTFVYDSFGNQLTPAQPTTNPYTAFGQYSYYLDRDSRFLAGARMPRADFGRWMSRDPIGFAAGDPNLYREVGNNPVNWADPSGKSSPCVLAIISCTLAAIDCICGEETGAGALLCALESSDCAEYTNECQESGPTSPTWPPPQPIPGPCCCACQIQGGGQILIPIACSGQSCPSRGPQGQQLGMCTFISGGNCVT